VPLVSSASSAGDPADDGSARADTSGPRPSADSAAATSNTATGRPPADSRCCSTGPGGREVRRTGRSLSANTAAPAVAAAAVALALDGDLVDRWTGPQEAAFLSAGQVSEESFYLSSEANARLRRPRYPPHLVTLLKSGRRLPRRWYATTADARSRWSSPTTQTPRAPRRQRRRPLRVAVAHRHPSTLRGPAHTGGPDRQLWTRPPPPKWTSFKPAPTGPPLISLAASHLLLLSVCSAAHVVGQFEIGGHS
jgi:hypothetical protein